MSDIGEVKIVSDNGHTILQMNIWVLWFFYQMHSGVHFKGNIDIFLSGVQIPKPAEMADDR